MSTVKHETETATCPACSGKGYTGAKTPRRDTSATCFYCEGTGIEPNGIAVEAPDKSEPMTYDLALPLTERSQGELVDSAQARVRGIYELDQQLVATVDSLDDVRRQMKAHTLRYINGGLPGNNEKQREAALAETLDGDAKYQGLIEEERRLHIALEQLRYTKDYLRRMHHLELALLQGDRP